MICSKAGCVDMPRVGLCHGESGSLVAGCWRQSAGCAEAMKFCLILHTTGWFWIVGAAHPGLTGCAMRKVHPIVLYTAIDEQLHRGVRPSTMSSLAASTEPRSRQCFLHSTWSCYSGHLRALCFSVRIFQLLWSQLLEFGVADRVPVCRR